MTAPRLSPPDPLAAAVRAIVAAEVEAAVQPLAEELRTVREEHRRSLAALRRESDGERDMIRAPEVCAILGVSRPTLRAMEARGEVPRAEREGAHHPRWDRAAIKATRDRWQREGRQRGGAPTSEAG